MYPYVTIFSSMHLALRKHHWSAAAYSNFNCCSCEQAEKDTVHHDAKQSPSSNPMSLPWCWFLRLSQLSVHFRNQCWTIPLMCNYLQHSHFTIRLRDADSRRLTLAFLHHSILSNPRNTCKFCDVPCTELVKVITMSTISAIVGLNH